MKKLNFLKQNGLVPAIAQDDTTGKVLMLGYINKEAYDKTLKEGYVYFFSRQRRKLWFKGEQSGNLLKVKQVFSDCDGDAILIKVKLLGKKACHKGYRSCFYKKIL